MARKVNARTIANRRALDAITGGLADGMGVLGEKILRDTHPPDAEPFGKGLVTTGAFGVWVGTHKVGGTATRPRSVRLPKQGITLLVGFGFPGRFQELGTINQPAQPFLTPGVLEEIPNTLDHLKSPVRRALATVP